MVRYQLLLILIIFSSNCFAVSSLWQVVSNNENYKTCSIDKNLDIKQSNIVAFDLDAINNSIVEINLFGSNYIVYFTFKEKHFKNSIAWIGRLQEESSSYFVISQTGEELYGKFWLDNGNQYLLVPTNVKAHFKLIHYDAEQVPCLFNDPNQAANYQNINIDNLCEDEEWCESSVIDVMSVYTASASNWLGLNEDQVNAGIVTAVAEANAVNQNSQVNFSWRLIHTEQIDYVESGSILQDFDYLQTQNDAVLDDLFDIRDEVGADLINLLLGLESGAGAYANRNWANNTYYSVLCHTVISAAYLFNLNVLSHELGHNLGLKHDDFTDSLTQASGNTACDGMEGFVNPYGIIDNDVDRLWHTVMAYNSECALQTGLPCSVIPYYSNADLTFGFGNIQDPIGIPLSEENPKHAVFMQTVQLVGWQILEMRQLMQIG